MSLLFICTVMLKYGKGCKWVTLLKKQLFPALKCDKELQHSFLAKQDI